MNPTQHTPSQDSDPLELMTRAFDSGVGVILETNDFSALLIHLQQALRPFAEACAAEDDEADDAAVDRAARGLATHIAYELWNATPIPENHFRPRKMPRPERNAPCPCGSGRKYKQCCGAVDTPPLDLAPDDMLMRVIEQLPSDRLEERVARGAPPPVLCKIAERWFGEGRHDELVRLLEPLFADPARLDGLVAQAASLLMNTYAHLERTGDRDALIERLKTSPDRELRSLALQREASVLADRDEFPAAWRAFREAQRLDPQDPTFAHLEVLLLMAEGRKEEARSRANIWAADLLARSPGKEYLPLIEALHAIVEDEDDDGIDWDSEHSAEVNAALAALPSDYPARRLVLHVALEGIEPLIWRRLEVENWLTFNDLHTMIQAAMGWEDAHLHEFSVGDYRIGNAPDFDTPFDELVLPGEEVELGQVIGRHKGFRYLYDFGDGWLHRITIEKRLPSAPQRVPAVLIDGARACPPEDCGGIPGYQRILAALRGEIAAEGDETLEAYADLDPEDFALAPYQRIVASLFEPIG